MSESIHFPSASKQSKLSACPTTKVPQSRDWIYQDIFNAMLHSADYQSFSPNIELFPKNNESYQVSQTLSEALETIANESYESEWLNQLDYNPKPILNTTVPYDRSSLPDLDSTFTDEEEEEEEEEEDRVYTPRNISHFDSAPVLIESSLSSCTTSTEQVIPYPYTTIANTLNKKRSTSSFGSFKSFINALAPTKKLKPNRSTKKKFFQFFKR